VLPASLANDENIRFMIYPKFAEVQTFLGYPVGRPRVLFPYSNQWGACIGILTPLAVAAVLQMRKSLKRRLFIGLLLLSLVPIVVSLNRGLWLALVAAVAYLGIRFVRLRNLKVLGAASAALAVAAAIVVATPLNGVLQDRLTTHSNSTNTRLSVYGKTTEQVKKSPLLGYGSPKASHDPNAPPAGTQGQLFLVGYSHGIPGLIFFVGWFLIGLLYSRRFNTREQPWAHVAFLILLLEIPYYSLMPTTLHAMMVIAALAWRNVVDPPPVPEAS
jgi:O-antigen ligase